jgi:hypothetical protein
MRLLVLVTALVLPSGLVWANAECTPQNLKSGMVPAPGETAVPINARVFVERLSWAARPAPVLKAADGTIVPVAEGALTFPAGSITVLSPNQLLEANATYKVVAGTEELGTFTTGTTSLTTTPATPRVVDTEQRSGTVAGGSPFGSTQYYSTYVTVEAAAPVIVVDIDTKATLDSAQVSGGVSHATDERQLDFQDDDSSCSINLGGPSASVRFGAFDVAGNFSGWSEPQEVTLPKDEGCGCANVAPSSASAGGVCALLLLAVWRFSLRRVVLRR